MDRLQSLYEAARAAWRELLPGALERGFVTAFLYLGTFFLIVLALEKAYGTRARNYRSRDFAHDVAYYLYYRSGAQRLLLTASLFAALSGPLAFLDLKLLAPLPIAAQVVLGLLLTDFVMYWLHRAQHAYRFLWAFHSTHHAEEQLTFASFQRFHPIEVFIGECVAYLLLLVLGFNIGAVIAVYLVTTFLGEVQHSRIPWKFGPLYKVLVTPSFHAYHHSPDRRMHDRNFGGLFSIWDYLFGTAVPDGAPPPATFGLNDVKVTSLWSTLVTPFHLLREFYFPRGTAKYDPRTVLDDKSKTA